MNANKIAEELENISWIQGDGTVKPFQQYADFVRQQQAEINRLKTLCILYIDDEWSGTSSYQAKIDEVNNERK